jgi:hypothetical protein
VAVNSGRWRHGEAGKPVEDHHDGVGDRFEGRGRRGAHRSSAPHGGAVGGGGSPVRGRWSGRGRSLCGRQVAPGRGDACGGGDEAGGGPERPAHGGVPSGEEEEGLSAEGIDGYGSDTRRVSRRSGRRDARDWCGARRG